MIYVGFSFSFTSTKIHQIGEIVQKKKKKTHKPTIKWNEMTTDFICVLWLHCTTTQSSRWIYERKRCCMCVEFEKPFQCTIAENVKDRLCSCVQLETANKHDEREK